VTHPSENSPGVQDQLDRLGELQVRLSQMVVQDPQTWHFEQLRHEADSLLAQAGTVASREKMRNFLEQLTRFEQVRSRGLEPAPTLAGNGRLHSLRPGPRETLAGMEANPYSPHLERHLDTLQRARSDLGAEPNGRAMRAGGDREESRVAALERSPDEVRYDAVGLLKPVVSHREHSPRYALVDDDGSVISFVTPTPDINLKPYIGRRIGVNGTRGFMPEFRRAHVTASRVTPIRR